MENINKNTILNKACRCEFIIEHVSYKEYYSKFERKRKETKDIKKQQQHAVSTTNGGGHWNFIIQFLLLVFDLAFVSRLYNSSIDESNRRARARSLLFLCFAAILLKS